MSKPVTPPAPQCAIIVIRDITSDTHFMADSSLFFMPPIKESITGVTYAMHLARIAWEAMRKEDERLVAEEKAQRAKQTRKTKTKKTNAT